MFTLKFIGHQEPNSVIRKSAVSVARYTVIEGFPVTALWAYQSLKEESPVMFDLTHDPKDDSYYEVFVENIAGKTIDRYRGISNPGNEIQAPIKQ